MFCRNCGYEQDGGRFCDRCGQPIHAPRPDPETQRPTPIPPPIKAYGDNNYRGDTYPEDTFYNDDPGAAYPDDGFDSYDEYDDFENFGPADNDTDYVSYESYRKSRRPADDYYDDYDAPAAESSRHASGSKKSNAFIIVACLAICTVGIFIIWTVFKLMTTDDSNNKSGGFVTTTAGASKKTAKPETKAPAGTTTTTTTAAPAPKNVEIIPASRLMDMDISEIRDLIGSDYRASWNEYTSPDGLYWQGITSDSYFPDTLINFVGMEFDSEDELLEAFESGDSDFAVVVLDGGLIGDGMKVGDSYHDLMTMVNCLGAIDPNTDIAESVVGGRLAYLYFDGDVDLHQLKRIYGSDVVDAFGTDMVCNQAIFTDTMSFGSSFEGTVTANSVALRVAPYGDASNLWNLNSGEKIKISSSAPTVECDGTTWYRVTEYRTDKGVWKHGYIHAEYVKTN